MRLTAIRPAHFPYFPYEGFTFSLGVTDGERAFLSGQSGAVHEPDAGKMVIRGDMGEQAAKMYEKIGVVLEAAGMSWADAVHLTENVSAAGIAGYDAAAKVRAGVLGAARPALTTVVVDRLVRRQALIELEVVARPGGGQQDGPVAVAGDEVILPTIHPVGPTGAVVAPGDYAAQLRYCLERAAGLLDGLGLSLADVVRTVDYTTPEDGGYAASRDVRAGLLAAPFPAAATITMNHLWRDDIAVSLDLVASRLPRQTAGPSWPGWEGEPVSPAIRVGRDLFVSGLASLDIADGRVDPGAGLEQQAESVYAGIVDIVETAGGVAADIAQTIEYVSGDKLGEYRAVAGVRERVLAPPWPASVGAVCSGFARPGAVLDAVARAVLPA